jgi:hypothetical protein
MIRAFMLLMVSLAMLWPGTPGNFAAAPAGVNAGLAFSDKKRYTTSS